MWEGFLENPEKNRLLYSARGGCLRSRSLIMNIVTEESTLHKVEIYLEFYINFHRIFQKTLLDVVARWSGIMNSIWRRVSLFAFSLFIVQHWFKNKYKRAQAMLILCSDFDIFSDQNGIKYQRRLLICTWSHFLPWVW